MKVRVDPDVCVGTGSCEAICPQVFEVGDEGVSIVKVNVVPPEHEAAVRKAIENCPVDAISQI
jgi:ferredoxin